MEYDVTSMCRNYACTNHESILIQTTLDQRTAEFIANKLNNESQTVCQICGELIVYYANEFENEKDPLT